MSIRVRITSSTKKGLPSARLRMRQRRAWGRASTCSKIADQGLAVGCRERLQPEVGVAMAVVAAGDLADLPRTVVDMRAEDEDEQQRGVIDERQQVL